MLFILYGLAYVGTHAQQHKCFFIERNAPIRIYSTDVGCDAFATIKQDSVKEEWFDVTILKTSNSRHRVGIKSASSESDSFIEGWVETRQCGVWIWPTEDSGCVYLYKEPTTDLPCAAVCRDSLLCEYASVNRISENGWYEVLIKTRDGILVGWTKNICTNIYGSCEHGNPYSRD